MTDRELLALAAKAAGIKWPQKFSDYQLQTGAETPWNPLTNDSDAFRLFLELEMSLNYVKDALGFRNDQIAITTPIKDSKTYRAIYADVSMGGDVFAIMRRAITEMAAEIGKQS